MLGDSFLRLFPNLTELQLEKFSALKPLYSEWNEKINLISRKDIELFNERHLIHSLALSFYWTPKKDDRVIDIGTGGGFPGVPLAILFPNTNFLLVDSIGKKIMVVNEVAQELDLPNLKAIQERAENIEGNYQTALTRAVARLKVLTKYCTKSKMRVNELICLKGGDLKEELNEIGNYKKQVYKLSDKLNDPFFDTKCVVRVDYS